MTRNHLSYAGLGIMILLSCGSMVRASVWVENPEANHSIIEAAYRVDCSHHNCYGYVDAVLSSAGYTLGPDGRALSPLEKPIWDAQPGNVIHTNTPSWHTAIIVGNPGNNILTLRDTNYPHGSGPHDHDVNLAGASYHIYAIAPVRRGTGDNQPIPFSDYSASAQSSSGLRPLPPLTGPVGSARAARQAREHTAGETISISGSLKIESGEIMLKGVVRSMDAETGEIKMDVVEVTDADGQKTSFWPNRQKVVRTNIYTVTRDKDNAEIACSYEDMAWPTIITVIGRDTGVGKEMPARVIAVHREAAAENS